MVFGLAVLTVSAKYTFQDRLQVVILLALAWMDFHELKITGDLLSIVGVVGSVEDGLFVVGGVSCCLELSMGKEDDVSLCRYIYAIYSLMDTAYRMSEGHLDTTYWSLCLRGFLLSVGMDTPYLLAGYGVLRQWSFNSSKS
nr:hypothetical protein [Tanacetum cinerariifolium]